MRLEPSDTDRGLFAKLREIWKIGRCVGRFVLFSNGHSTYGVRDSGSSRPEEFAYYGGHSTGGAYRKSAGDVGDFLKQVLDKESQLAVMLSLLKDDENLQRQVANVLHKNLVMGKPIRGQQQYDELVGRGAGYGN